MPNGGAVANITIATSESWKDKSTGEQKEKVEWHKIVFYRRLAEVVGQYLKKGSKIYIEGKLQTRKWPDKDGKDCYTTEIIANEMQMLDSRSGAASSPGNAVSGQHQKSDHTGHSPQAAKPNQSGDWSDDIPF